MKHLILLALAAASLTTFWACSSANAVANASDKFDPDYYTNLGSNHQRLVALLTGTFMQRTYDKRTEKERTWLVNDNQDSLILLSQQVGDPNKHGYWIFQYQYMTHLPDEGFYSSLVNVQQIDRDTFHLVFHKPARTYTFEEMMSEDFDEDMEFKNLLEGKTRVYIRDENSRTRFHGYSPMASRKVKKGEDETIMIHLRENLDLQPERLRMGLLLYDNPEDKEPKKEHEEVTYFRRIKSVPGWSGKKSKKKGKE